MKNNSERNINEFRIAGINYKKSDASLRGQFAINNDQYARILSIAPQMGINEFFIVSTCNRTEIYGFAPSHNELLDLLATECEGSREVFEQNAYFKSGHDAVEHLFHVSAGLDSQILGDFEILGQIKNAIKFSKDNGCIGAYMERMLNSVLQCTKSIKTHTALSNGTVSVAFAAVSFIKEHHAEIKGKKILLVGTGKIGRNTCKNMVDYLGTQNITLINRTEEKAAELAKELGLTSAPLSQLDQQVAESDIIVLATNSVNPIITCAQLQNGAEKLIIDMSIPCNVEAGVPAMQQIHFVGVDELSKIKDETLQMRKAEVPKAKAIIAQHIDEFMTWHNMRKNVPVLKEVKSKLIQLNTSFHSYNGGHIANYGNDSDEKIQKVINTLAIKMRAQSSVGCYFIEALNEFIV
jgi:glutamyl-tRNA reductase